MAEILGLGVTHWPTLCMPNEGLTGVFKTTLRAPNVEAARKDPVNWPAELIAELGNDDGLSAANRCGERFGNDFRAIRKILNDFNPDLVVVWATTNTRTSARTSSRPSACSATTISSRSSPGKPMAMGVTAANRTAGASRATGH